MHQHTIDTSSGVAWNLPQVHAYGDVLVGVVSDAGEARAILAELRQVGFASQEVGAATRSRARAEASGLLAAPAGADGGPFDALVDLGIPGAAARFYQREFETCRGILAVTAGDRAPEAVALLRGCRPLDPPARPATCSPR